MTTKNDYQSIIDLALYEKIPKAVLAAIVVSHLMNFQGFGEEEVTQAIKSEWNILYNAGLVPQKPVK